MLLLIACACSAQPDYVKVKRELESAKTLQQKKSILLRLRDDGSCDQDLQEELERLASAWDGGYSWAPEDAIEMISLRATLSSQPVDNTKYQYRQQAAKIKDNPLYNDPGFKESSNWFSRAMERFFEMIANALRALFNRAAPETRLPNVDAPQGFFATIGGLLKVLVYGLLALALGFFAFLVLRHFQWKGKLSRKATALLEDDEPERSRDEWLELAQRLTGEGRYREAVRCLYLASLLRFDEAGIARFIRSQTNWEHLARIRSSPSLPDNLDFSSPTQSFDRIWYGFQIRGIEDVEAFRSTYEQVSKLLGHGAKT